MTGQTAKHPRGLNNGGFDIDQVTVFSALHMLFYRPAFGGWVGWGGSYILLHYQLVFSQETINLDCVTSAKSLWTGFVYRVAGSKSDH